MGHFIPDDLDEAAEFHRGVALFNAGEWFEAHEVWESVWVLASGQRKRFYQGLIQAAVTLEHARRGNPRGVRTVYDNCVRKFEGVPARYMGVDVAGLLEGLGRSVGPVLGLPAEWFDPSRGRGQAIPFDGEKAPRITLSHDPFAGSGAGE
jgi:predicted metal-dependent hydrolase